jgi:rhodanese-related sulfurtransferase
MKRIQMLLLLLAMACSPAEKKDVATVEPSENTLLDAASFKEKLSQDDQAILLDVRTPAEVAEGIIPGAIVIDFTAPDFADKIAALDKDKDYYVYCKMGGRSTKAAAHMSSVGFRRVINLEGGYAGWVEKGFETAIPE